MFFPTELGSSLTTSRKSLKPRYHKIGMPTQEDGSDGPNSSAFVAQPEVRTTCLACRATLYNRPLLATAPTTPTRRPRVAQNVSSKRRTQTPLLLIQIPLHRKAKFFLFDVAAVKWNDLGIGSVILLLEKDKKTTSMIMKSRTKIYANFTSKLVRLYRCWLINHFCLECL